MNLVDRTDAFSAWAADAAPRLVRIARLLTGDVHAGEDLTQEVLEKIYARWTHLEDPDAYARRALANAVTSRWRRRSRRPEVLLELDRDAATAHPRHDPHPGTEQRLDLMAELARLPSRQRAVVVLRYLDDLSERDVAELLDISVGTVKSQSARGLTRLRERWAAPTGTTPIATGETRTDPSPRGEPAYRRGGTT
ncbi:SigE family RNA polymerase sigma factor [Kineococcus sp. R8]|uniref:SigE family RNA polymerase sigma factor n=1 Tax=Kineococcus siccus TaxID=2696567 RepID=UPI001411EA5E|nr:SigE family RNA polymerase sigma factor [Kineococcus siccus]